MVQPLEEPLVFLFNWCYKDETDKQNKKTEKMC